MNGGYVGMVGALIGIYLLNTQGPKFNKERSVEALFLVLTAAAPMIILEVTIAVLTSVMTGSFIHSSHFSSSMEALSLRVLGCRTLGAAATVLLVSFVYWTLDEYHSSFMAGVFDMDDRPQELQCGASCRPKYYNFFRCLGLLVEAVGWQGVATIAIVYIGFTTQRLACLGGDGVGAGAGAGGKELQGAAIKDGLYYTGEACWLLLWRPLSSLAASNAQTLAITTQPIAQHFLEVFVRCFFSPLMFCALCDNLPMLHYKGLPTFMEGFYYFQNIVFTVDLTFATVGYSLPGSKLLGSDFKSVESTVLGFVCTLICYYPFFDTLTGRYLDYSKNPPWNVWFDRLNGNQDASGWILFRAWGVVLSLLQMAYALCTMHYGLGYSNNSYRKILKTGPYAITRHPQYWTKLLSFAMLSVPWVNLRPDGGYGRALRNMLSLVGLALVYVLRASTEERHLVAAGADYPYETFFSRTFPGFLV